MGLKSIKPLSRAPLLHVSVQESLRAYIDENGLQAGAPLPPEGDLAHQLGVSRNSVREGIKALESVGVLESRRGVGVFVKAFSFEPLLENLAYGLGGALKQIEEVIVIRRTLEVGLIDKTLKAIGPEDIRELREVLERMRIHAERNEAFVEEDKLFHTLLFRCQKNETLVRLIEVFWMAFYKASNFVNLENTDPMQTWRDHKAIVDAVEAGNLGDARGHLDRHYEGIARVIEYNKISSAGGRV
ncbi:FadR/GntR family transcriptional regulator [Phyllobacterium myrsinacearum]|uniref:GntR family transcriptional regulator n=1 Tax=Phyllobacterium myrsinacearum TaxID=28101 RepID=A0A2S9JP91_9HYPH|nr:FadR/GntR family transcriptional regulator [Phyllobacterium myrsinacearum]PRD54979.1 GntR family transcriptional regulator [Phyllobacterium myrsinacearum]PWV90476.1 GntR family transcriptional regulator [Phyllobacterium myrsinacearum]RZS79873.1 GntR family transcriptional regulator [Phyllobacterium myrsinacearum]RZV05331.1 DNA-binding FadR family transcriptional regulator [Phyllobacterium myrsinacearum]